MKKLTLGISAAALALAGAAMAAGAPSPAPAPAPAFGPAPIAPDKVLTRAEAKAHAEEAFAKLDINHDGKLDKADQAARWNEHFDKIDTNHDSAISREEFAAAHEAMRAGKPDGQPGAGPEGAPPPPGAGPDGQHGPERGPGHGRGWGHQPQPFGGAPLVFEILRIADPAHAGSVSKEGFVAASLKLFDEADANHDGKVTPEERSAAFAKHRPEWAKRGPHGGPHHGPHGGPDGGPDGPPPPPLGGRGPGG